MSTDVITGNDLKAILGEVLPASQGVFCELIWTNPNGHTNLTCTMEESTVTIDEPLSKYNGFIIEFRNYYNAGDKTTEIYFSKCQGMYGRTIISATLSNPTVSYGRHWYPVSSSNGFYFSDCTRYTSNAASVVGSDTGCLVPMRIYGFKLYGTSQQPLEVADYIIEQGTSGDWFYRKWYSGRIEADLVTTNSIAMTTAIGNEYFGNITVNISSLGLLTIRNIQVTGDCPSFYSSSKVESVSLSSFAISTRSNSSMTGTVTHYIHIEGTWK